MLTLANPINRTKTAFNLSFQRIADAPAEFRVSIGENMAKDLIKTDYSTELARIQPEEIRPLFEKALSSVREEVADNPYIVEAIRVLPVGGYRSAIGSFWNAVVDDLRNKIIHRSLELFNKATNISPPIKTYEDFQNRVNDDQLIDGAYQIGVIGWEASKVLKHAKETRHIFDGHPKSSDPSVLKVLVMMEDSIKYVLNEPYPVQIIDIDEYIATMDTAEYDRNEIAAANALSELPEIYKEELSNRLFTVYIDPHASSVIRSNIEFIAPILWKVLPKKNKLQIVRRVDQEFPKGDSIRTKYAFDFVTLVGSNSYLSVSAREYIIKPLIDKLKNHLDVWKIENECVRELSAYASQIPPTLVQDYVWSLTQTYVGHIGGRAYFSRTDFYANGAATYIPTMFEAFDDTAVEAFVYTLKTNTTLKRRIDNPTKLNRLRSLGNIALERASSNHPGRDLLEKLVTPEREPEFIDAIRHKQ
jgi:hypothetical protein